MLDDRDFTGFAAPRAGIDRQPDEPVSIGESPTRRGRPAEPDMPLTAKLTLIGFAAIAAVLLAMNALEHWGMI